MTKINHERWELRLSDARARDLSKQARTSLSTPTLNEDPVLGTGYKVSGETIELIRKFRTIPLAQRELISKTLEIFKSYRHTVFYGEVGQYCNFRAQLLATGSPLVTSIFEDENMGRYGIGHWLLDFCCDYDQRWVDFFYELKAIADLLISDER